MRGARPPTASHFWPHTASHGLLSPRPPTICHVICLSQWESSNLWGRSVRPWEAMGGNVRPKVGGRGRPCESEVWSDSTERGNAFSREISQTAPRIGLHRPVCVRGRSGSASHRQITWLCGERLCSASHGLPPRPPTSASHFGLSDRPCDLSESPKWEAMWEADRPLTHTGPVAPLPAKAMHLAEDRTASPAVRERPIGLPHGLSLRTLRQITRPHRSASQIGLSDRSHSLTDLTD